MLGPFFVITFGLAWGILALYIFATDWAASVFGAISGTHPLFMLAVYAPAIAGIALVAVHGGGRGLRRYLGRLLLWRTSWSWLLFLLLGIPVIFVAGALWKGNVDTAPLLTEPWPALLAALAFMLVLGPIEEIGWRGFALPLLQRRMAPFWAGLVLGLIWALWHLPAFFLSGTPQGDWGFAPFFIGSVAASVILTPLFNQSGGSILLAMLFHYQLINPLWPDAQPYDIPVFVLVAVVVTWLNRRTLFTREGAVTVVVPGSEEKVTG
jgi:membrane protease YdiL (CAAX protease family)